MEKIMKRSRVSLTKRLIRSFILIMTLSIVTSVILITVFYSVYHRMNGHDFLNISNARYLEILEYIQIQGTSIMEEENLEELTKITREIGIFYEIRDVEKDILKGDETEFEGRKKKGYIKSAWNELKNNLYHTPTINVPVYDNTTQKVKYVVVLLNQSNTSLVVLSMIDIFVPVACFLFYTFLFASQISKSVKTPAKELMNAVEKIKSKDLDFSINCSGNDNELIDLARAMEEMRSDLMTSIVREWQLEEDRRNMVSSITHDIRTPLAIIQGHVEVLQDGIKSNPEKLDSYLNTIEQNVKRVKILIDEMNLLEEVDNPGFILNASPIDLNDFLSNKANELRVLAIKKQIRIVTEVTDTRKDNTLVMIDYNRLAQVIDNLVGNSIRFTPESGIILMRVKIEEKMADFSIVDEGQGFSEKDLSNIFKKFYKGDPSRSIQKGHSGLGLYITKTIIEKHGGEISASNLSEGGACITFKIQFMES